MYRFNCRMVGAARRGFTLVELLIAMTITLLLMVGLAKSFAIIGKSIKTGRSQVTLSSKLRGISFRVRGDLRLRTADAVPPMTTERGQGYFMYYEGPLTEHTFGLFGAEPTRTTTAGEILLESDPTDSEVPADGIPDYYDPDIEKGPTYRRHSRFGDFDDYIAFTAEASGDDWFTGKVPAYLVDDDALDPMAPVVIRSKYAEIIIWASPKWQVDPGTNTIVTEAHPSAMPLYTDNDNDLVPDNVVLHQRILLIRPDLNLRRTVPASIAGPQFAGDVLRPLLASANPYSVPTALQRLYPIGEPNPPATAPTNSMFPNYAVGGSATDNRLMLSSNWLVGMTALHHFYDLSLRRISHPRTGQPSGYVAANSLEDLVHPHNRFAHVRYPGRYMNRGTFGGGDFATSMPLLALGWNDKILNWQGTSDPRANPPTLAQPSWFPTSHPSPVTRNGAGTATPADDSDCGLFNGWLLPHFELGDANPVGTSSDDHWERGYLATADSRWDRSGEDVIAANILAFDVRAYDPSAPVFVTSGRDAAPGVVNVDDDSTGTNDVTTNFFGQASTELGTFGSDDELVQVSDLAIYNVLGQSTLDPNNAATFGATFAGQALSTRGGFVDLLYPYLAGSPLRERTNQARTIISNPPLVTIPTTPFANAITPNALTNIVQRNYAAFMGSDFSAFELEPTAMNSLKRSGKLLHRSAAGHIWFLQPTYDTWTDAYEFDGFDQTHTFNGNVTGAVQVGTTWVLNTVSGINQAPRLTSAVQPSLQIDTGRFIATEPETSAPFASNLPAIQVSIRVFDPHTRGMAEFTVVEAMQ